QDDQLAACGDQAALADAAELPALAAGARVEALECVLVVAVEVAAHQHAAIEVVPHVPVLPDRGRGAAAAEAEQSAAAVIVGGDEDGVAGEDRVGGVDVERGLPGVLPEGPAGDGV